MAGGKGNCLELPKMSLPTPTPKSRPQAHRVIFFDFYGAFNSGSPANPKSGEILLTSGAGLESTQAKMAALGRQRNQVPVRIRTYPTEVITGPVTALHFS